MERDSINHANSVKATGDWKLKRWIMAVQRCQLQWHRFPTPQHQESQSTNAKQRSFSSDSKSPRHELNYRVSWTASGVPWYHQLSSSSLTRDLSGFGVFLQPALIQGSCNRCASLKPPMPLSCPWLNDWPSDRLVGSCPWHVHLEWQPMACGYWHSRVLDTWWLTGKSGQTSRKLSQMEWTLCI